MVPNAHAQQGGQVVMDGVFEAESLRTCMVFPNGQLFITTSSMVPETATMSLNQVRPSSRQVGTFLATSTDSVSSFQVTDGLYCLTGQSNNERTTPVSIRIRWVAQNLQ